MKTSSMASFFDGNIESIRPDIMDDIEKLIEWIDPDDDFPNSVLEARDRVEAYIATYKAHEEKV